MYLAKRKGIVSVVSICIQVFIYIYLDINMIFQSHFTGLQFYFSLIPVDSGPIPEDSCGFQSHSCGFLWTPVDSCGFLQEWVGHCKVLNRNNTKSHDLTTFGKLKEGATIVVPWEIY